MLFMAWTSWWDKFGLQLNFTPKIMYVHAMFVLLGYSWLLISLFSILYADFSAGKFEIIYHQRGERLTLRRWDLMIFQRATMAIGFILCPWSLRNLRHWVYQNQRRILRPRGEKFIKRTQTLWSPSAHEGDLGKFRIQRLQNLKALYSTVIWDSLSSSYISFCCA